jgi:hypothetical protein
VSGCTADTGTPGNGAGRVVVVVGGFRPDGLGHGANNLGIKRLRVELSKAPEERLAAQAA